MKCWECGIESTQGGNFLEQRWYCDKCFTKYNEERESDRAEYIRLKKKLMLERATRIMEKQRLRIYEYKEALDAIKEISIEDPNKFDSAHEMVAGAIIIENEIRAKHHFKIAGCEVDFFIPELKAVLEIDGNFHEYSINKDYKRDMKIREELGMEFEVVRIGTKYIEQNAELLIEAIKTIREEKQKIRKQNHGIIPEWFAKSKKRITV